MANLKECIRTGWLSWQGRFVAEFESRFARYCGARYAVSTGSGTAALIFSLLSLDLRRGDEIIVPALTFSAPVNAVAMVGATPIFADSEPQSFGVDPADIERQITRRTRAIIVVHLYGYPVDMNPILAMARRHRLAVIEDAAEAIGAEYHGRKVGSLGNFGCFSFHNKHIATGEGGMVTVGSRTQAKRIVDFKNPAPNNRARTPAFSLSLRMSNLEAAVGVAQLARLEQVIRGKRAVARYYDQCLCELKSRVTAIPERPLTRSVYWRYTVFVQDSKKYSRDALIRFLNRSGIQARAIFLPMHLHSFYRKGRSRGKLPHAERMAAQGIDLPTSPKLTRREQDYVVAKIHQFFGKR